MEPKILLVLFYQVSVCQGTLNFFVKLSLRGRQSLKYFLSCFFTISLFCQVPDGELHAACAGQSVRDPDPGLEWRGADTRDGLCPARHRGRREAGQGAQTGAQGASISP